MQKAFEKIVERLEKKIDNLTNNQQLFEKKHDLSMSKICESEIVAYEDAIEIVNQVAGEYKHVTTCYLQSPCEYQNEDIRVDDSNDGWIPCSERLPERNKQVLCWAKSTARGGDVCFTGSCDNGAWFLQTAVDTLSYPTQYEVVAWRELPASYQPKGE